MLIQSLPPQSYQVSYQAPLAAMRPQVQPQAAAPLAGDRIQLAALPAGALSLKPPALLFGQTPLAPQPGQGSVAGKVTLDLLSLNVYGLPKPVGKNIAERSAVIGSTLGRYDIAALQETFSKDTGAIAKTLAATHAGPSFQNYKPKDHRLGDSGLQIFSRYPIVEKDFMPFRFATDEDALSKKGVAFTRVNVPNIGFVDIYDTHYQANGDKDLPWHKDLLYKAASLVLPGMLMKHEDIRLHDNQVMAALVKKHDQGYPTFIMGDFNTVEERESVYKDLVQRLGLRDSYKELNPGDPGYTSDGVLNPIKGGTSRKRLDYIFYRPGKNVDVTPILSEIAYNKPGEYVSDHFGVHTRFELVKRAN